MPAKKAKKKTIPTPRPAARRATHKVRRKKTAHRATPPAVLTPPPLGAVWPGQGGVYVGDIRGENGQPNYHLVTPAHLDIKGAWGPTAKVAGALSRYDGMANTQAMVAAGSALAKKVRALKHDGHSDYYIGAAHEARLADINGREHFPQDAWLWTSTQDELGDDWAWLQLFGGYGAQGLDRKSDEYRAFVLRRVPIR